MKECQTCEEIIGSIKSDLGRHLHQDALSMVTMLLTIHVHQRLVSLRTQVTQNENKRALLQRMSIKRDVDFTSAIIAKFAAALEPETKTKLVETLKKIGITMNISEEDCPHGERP